MYDIRINAHCATCKRSNTSIYACIAPFDIQHFHSFYCSKIDIFNPLLRQIRTAKVVTPNPTANSFGKCFIQNIDDHSSWYDLELEARYGTCKLEGELCNIDADCCTTNPHCILGKCRKHFLTPTTRNINGNQCQVWSLYSEPKQGIRSLTWCVHNNYKKLST